MALLFSLSAVLCSVLCMSDAPVKSSQFLAGESIINTTNCVAIPKMAIAIGNWSDSQSIKRRVTRITKKVIKAIQCLEKKKNCK